ncbi:hypothetical protein QR680_010801 [Steinernema hermaphroditum]|uniref:Peptidase A1 domain-containing protein n=1 Tax=Steinernema hermaphroditum TaxID=289476 RepID=A0AA39MBA0_9BILA|nr:hypothetical protein QR680_010801 [Steinernema hermaphroditum]
MLKLTAFCALLCLSAGAVVPKTETSVKIPSGKSIYKHPFHNYNLVAVAVWVGQPQQLIGNAYVDTTVGDVEIKVCSSANPTRDEEPCYNSYKSQTFIRNSPTQAMEVMRGDNVDDQYMLNITFSTNCDLESRFGFGWPQLRKYPSQTFYPYVYLGQKGVDNKFLISIAKDGCVSQIDWGSQCTSDKYPTNFVPATSNKYWEFKLNGFTLGDVDETFESHAVIATMRAYIGMPKKYLEKMMASLNISWDDEVGAYTTWCYIKMPDFKLKLQGLELTMKSEQYLYTWLPLENGKCVVNFEDSAANGFGPEWYFGLPLMASYCTTFDYDHYQIGFMYNEWYADNRSCHYRG